MRGIAGRGDIVHIQSPSIWGLRQWGWPTVRVITLLNSCSFGDPGDVRVCDACVF